MTLNTDFGAKLLHDALIVLLHPPPEFLSEDQHLVFLMLGKFGPEALFAARPRPIMSGGTTRRV